MRFGRSGGPWTAFDLTTRGAEPRYISLLEQEGKPLGVVARPASGPKDLRFITLGRARATWNKQRPPPSDSNVNEH